MRRVLPCGLGTMVPGLLLLGGTILNVVHAKEGPDTKKTMITGIAAGLGFIVGLAILVTTIWCCCCNNFFRTDGKVGPSDTPTGPTSDENEPEKENAD